LGDIKKYASRKYSYRKKWQKEFFKKKYSLYFQKKNHQISPEILLELFQHISTLALLMLHH
jgi:hypothetical protein